MIIRQGQGQSRVFQDNYRLSDQTSSDGLIILSENLILDWNKMEFLKNINILGQFQYK